MSREQKGAWFTIAVFTGSRRRVDGYFERTGHSRRDCPQMYFKTATIVAWFAAAYVLLLFVATTWWLVVPLAVVLGLAVAAIGFNIQHDGGHKAYSERRWVNKIMAMSLDVMGGSSYMWDWKHNSIHHTYPNVNGEDDDINLGFLGRLSPQQPRYRFHRLQGIYLWLFYGFLAIDPQVLLRAEQESTSLTWGKMRWNGSHATSPSHDYVSP